MTNEPVSISDLAAIPADTRKLVARWLVERAASFQPSWLLSEEAARAIHNAMTGAAVDLTDPDAEDSTLDHAAAVLRKLRADR